jgi:hypothetical protein
MASSPNAGGSDYGLKVYGNSDTQMSELNSGNLIHMNKPLSLIHISEPTRQP